MLSAGELLCEAFEFLDLDVNKSYEPLTGGCCVTVSAGNSEPEPLVGSSSHRRSHSPTEEGLLGVCEPLEVRLLDSFLKSA